MTYKQPTFKDGKRKVSNFKDFIQQLPNEKQELKKVKKSFKKNDLSVGQKERKLKYNKVTHKLDDVGEADIQDRLDQFEEEESSEEKDDDDDESGGSEPHPILKDLPDRIRTVYDAERLLLILAKHHMLYHFDGSAEEIFEDLPGNPGKKIDKLMSECFDVCSTYFGEGKDLWEGLVKDVIPAGGIITFSAQDHYSYISYQEKNSTNVVRMNSREWDRIKTKYFINDRYSDEIIDYLDTRKKYNLDNI